MVQLKSFSLDPNTINIKSPENSSELTTPTKTNNLFSKSRQDHPQTPYTGQGALTSAQKLKLVHYKIY